MKPGSRLSPNQSEQLPRDMIDLATAISRLPAEHRSQLEPVYQRVADSTRRRRRILNLVQEALSQLRLDMKYLLFDLEATRRERNEYRRCLDDSGDAEE